MDRKPFSIGTVLLLLVCALNLCLQAALGAEALRYTFKGTKNPIYQVAIRAEMPDGVETHSGPLSYSITSTDPGNGQVTFSYSSSLQVQKTQRKENADPRRFPPPPPMPPFSVMFGTAPQSAPEIVIDPDGSVIRSNRVTDDVHLPFMLGLRWQLMLQQLPDEGQATWKTKRIINLFSKKQQKEQWPPPPPWERNQEERTERSAHENVVYTLAEPDGQFQPIRCKYELTSDEKVGEAPALRRTGEGQFVFDKESGLLDSMNMKYTIEVNETNVTVKIPVTVDVRRLNDQEVAKLKTEQEAAALVAKERSEKARAKNLEKQRNSKLPAGAKQTELIGGTGGGPFVNTHPDKLPVLGFRCTMSTWGGKPCVHTIEPVYERPSGDKKADPTLFMAKEGFAVGGLLVDGKNSVVAVRVIFMRLKDGHIDPKDRYNSEWSATPLKEKQTKLAANGDMVIGVYGRQGLNTDALGLVVQGAASTDEK